MAAVVVPILLVVALTSGAAVAPAAEAARAWPVAVTAKARSAPLTTTASIRRARRFARGRAGHVAFAVLDHRGRPRGLRRTTVFASASVSKAMLMVAVLRSARGRRLSDAERNLLRPMVTASDNAAADVIYARVGDDGLRRVARAAGMHRFAGVGHWAGARVTAADQARLFLRIDKLVPPAHRRNARTLLSRVVSYQRWGIARVARHARMKIFFKGGWRDGITHQVALLERRGRRIALAILTSGSPSFAYAEETIEGIAARVLE